MTTTIQVSVTQEDIEHGDRRCRGTCPVARALDRWLLPPGALVDYKGGAIESGTSYYSWTRYYFFALPDTAASFMKTFDVGGRVEPFSFMITLPSELLKPELREIRA
jgi:hypothetical protein